MFYQESFGTEVLNRASRDVSQFFGRADFKARSLLIATWDSMKFKDEEEVSSSSDQRFCKFVWLLRIPEGFKEICEPLFQNQAYEFEDGK